MRKKQKLSSLLSVVLLVALIFISSFIASIVQTSFGNVNIELKELETDNGQTLIYDLYKPKLADSSNKVPPLHTEI